MVVATGCRYGRGEGRRSSSTAHMAATLHRPPWLPPSIGAAPDRRESHNPSTMDERQCISGFRSADSDERRGAGGAACRSRKKPGRPRVCPRPCFVPLQNDLGRAKARNSRVTFVPFPRTSNPSCNKRPTQKLYVKLRCAGNGSVLPPVTLHRVHPGVERATTRAKVCLRR